MYRCGNKVKIGDCVAVNVSVMVSEMNVPSGTLAVVLETNLDWIPAGGPLLTLLFPDESIQELPASWCTLCQRK